MNRKSLPEFKTDPKVIKALAEAVEFVKNMTEGDRKAMYEAQRQSWVRAFKPTGDPRFD